MPASATVIEDLAAEDGRTPAVDGAVLDQLASDLGDTDGELRAEIVQLYLDEGEPQIQALLAAASLGDTTTLRLISHTLRSTSSTLGAAGLAHLLQRVEDVSRQTAGEDPPNLGMLCRAVADEYRLVAGELAHYAVPASVAA